MLCLRSNSHCKVKGGGKCICPCLSVCLSVCYMDLDEMLRVDRRRDMDELIDFEPDPDYSPYARTGLLLGTCETEISV